MPDGGGDNCANCLFNARWGSYHDPDPDRDRSPLADCVLRGVSAPDPFWTYCDWFESGDGNHPEFGDLPTEIIENRPKPFELEPDKVLLLRDRALSYLTDNRLTFNPVMTSGLGTGSAYSRIPWDGNAIPVVAGEGTCELCGKRAEETVQILPAGTGEQLRFCSDACYLNWWLSRHPLPPEPEEYDLHFYKWHLWRLPRL